MDAKVYVQMYCEVVRRNVLLSYNVNYVGITPVLNENRCEFHADSKCLNCLKAEERNALVKAHFEDQFKNLPLMFLVEKEIENS